jgi:hypothetical protein
MLFGELVAWSINELSSCEATYFWMREHSRKIVSVCGGHLQLISSRCSSEEEYIVEPQLAS